MRRILLALSLALLPSGALAETERYTLATLQACETLETVVAQMEEFERRGGQAVPFVPGCTQYTAATPFGIRVDVTELAPITVGEHTWMIYQVDIISPPPKRVYSWIRIDEPGEDI